MVRRAEGGRVRALITGITGQDGSHLAQLLTAGGHEVWGTVRGHATERRDRLAALVPTATLIEADLLDQASLTRAVAESAPDVVFNLAGVSAPALAWAQPTLASDVIGLGFVRVLEAVRYAAPRARVVQAGSLATHGVYGAAKAYTHAVAADYRAQGASVTVAVLGGHHSPRRGREFFARKVTAAAARHYRDPAAPKLELGWLGRSQDWGAAPTFVHALALLAELPPGEYSVSTGDPHTSAAWVEAAYAAVGLDWRDYVTVSGQSQPTDVPTLTAAPDERLLAAGWDPTAPFAGLAAWMTLAEGTREAW
jgi:GDPmannose 4,6-dehydratase